MPQQLCPVVIGREVELDVLSQALTAVVAREGRCVSLVGEPGIGKSRLTREVADWAAERGLAVLTGRAVPGSGSAPYRPVGEALSQLVRHRSPPDDPALRPWLPLLGPLLPAVADRAGTADVPASLRGEAVLQLLGTMCPDGSVLVLEDLHWADPDTVALVEYLAANLAGNPLLVVVTMRESPSSKAWEVARRQRGQAGVAYLALERLNDEQSAAMVRACRPDAAADEIARIRETSEGVPLLVEELLASPGLPVDLAATVRTRLGALSDAHRVAIEAAAVLGRQFDWELLAAMTGQSDEAVSDAVAAGVRSQLLESRGTQLRFRHALTRDAVLDTVLPPRQRQLAAAALVALAPPGSDVEPQRRELAVDLALRAGARDRAGVLLAESGRQSLAWGALATAADTLRRAADLLAGSAGQSGVELDLVQALSLAGRVDEAGVVGGRLINRLGQRPDSTALRVETHLRLAHAAVAASRRQMARYHLDEARRLSEVEAAPSTSAHIDVLEADLAMAADDYDAARSLVEEVLVADDVAPEVRCHAFEIRGRSHRLADLPAARSAFESALVSAEAADLPLWRLRALHELGTIELFDHAGVERLLQAHRAAVEMGAMSTAAVLDLQLAAAFTCRWDLEACDAYAHSAITIAEPLGLNQVRAKALAMLSGSAGMRADLRAAEHYAQAAISAAPEDLMLEGFCWGGRGLALLLAGDEDAAMEPWAHGMAILAQLPHAEPAALRALWPLVLAVRGDERSQAAVDDARRLGVAAFGLNRSMVAYAEAILVGRRGDRVRARELAVEADRGWSNCLGWADLARALAGPDAASDGWADVPGWLEGADERFRQRGLPSFSRRCQDVRAVTSNPWVRFGVSPREADVLRLVGEGLPNKEIASRLHLSPRTVEKHVESLLRKAGARSRTELVTRLFQRGGATAGPPSPERST